MNGMAGSVYTVLTMAGKFEAIFSADEDVPVAYVGDEAPIEFFKDWLLLNQISGEHGHLLNAQNLTPRELYGFCQPPDSGIEVIPPFDDFLLYIQEDAANQIEYNEKQPEELSAMETEIVIGSDDVLDGAYSDADKTAISATLQLFKAFKSFIDSDKQSARIPDSMPNVNGTSVMNKDEAKKLLRYLLDVAINRKAGIPDMTEEQRKRLSDYQWDARVIYDYMTNRVRSRGSRNLLRTPEMKKKYPEIDNQPREEFDSAISEDEVKDIVDVTLDGISGIEKIKLIKEAGAIRLNLKTVQSGVEKLKMVKRIKDIRDVIGVGDGNGLDKDGLDADGMWPMTRAEYNKIHEDYKGTMPDGTPSALKLINGATTIVPVKITDESPSGEIKTQFNIGDYVVAIKDVGFYGESPMEINHIKTDFGNDGAQRLKLEGKGNMYFNASDFAKAENNGESTKKEVAKSMSDVREVLPVLMRFVGNQQLETMLSSAKGEEEGQFFIDKMLEVANIVSTMPKTYEQDGMGDDAVVYLHYFKGSSDWYITERDMEEEQLQAFGYAKIGSEGELGYINIDDLTRINVELDLYWKPKTIGAIKGQQDEKKEDPNIGREWNSVWGRQKIIGIYGGDLYEVKTIEDGSIRRYSINSIEEIISGDEYKLTSEYAKEVSDREEINRLREESRKAADEASAKTDAQIAEFAKSKGMSPPNAEKARQALVAQIRYNGDKIMSRKEMIEQLVSEGRIVEARDGGRELTLPGSDISMSENSTTKTGMDYAEYLISKKVDSNKESKSFNTAIKTGFLAELDSLKKETDIASFGDRLDEIAARIEQAGLSAELDAELNSAADALTVLMAAAEKTS